MGSYILSYTDKEMLDSFSMQRLRNIKQLGIKMMNTLTQQRDPFHRVNPMKR